MLDDPLTDGGAAPFRLPSGLGVFGRPGKLLLSAALTEEGGHACYPGREIEEITVELPPGAALVTLPRDVTEQAGGASYHSRSRLTDGVLEVQREFSLSTPHQVCTQAEFDQMRPVLAAAKRDARTQISLTRSEPQQLARAPAGELSDLKRP